MNCTILNIFLPFTHYSLLITLNIRNFRFIFQWFNNFMNYLCFKTVHFLYSSAFCSQSLLSVFFFFLLHGFSWDLQPLQPKFWAEKWWYTSYFFILLILFLVIQSKKFGVAKSKLWYLQLKFLIPRNQNVDCFHNGHIISMSGSNFFFLP